MKNARLALKFLSGILLMVFVLTAVFYFWGSHTHSDPMTYSAIKKSDNEFPSFTNDTITIVTYNIGYLSGLNNNLPVKTDLENYSKNLHEAMNLFRKLQPDLISFQEIDFASNRSFYFNQFDSIGNYCNYPNGAYAINWDKNYVPFPYWPPSIHFGRMLSGQGILSHFPIISNTRVVLQEPENSPFYYNAFYLDRLLQISEIEINGQIVIIMNVHLEAFDKETREKQSLVLIEFIEQYIDNFPLILTGDFNCRPPFKGVQGNEEQTLRNILESTRMKPCVMEDLYLTDPVKFYTFDSRNPIEKIDYIFYDPQKFSLIEAKVLNEAGEISDHLPLYAKFIMKKN